MNSIWNLRITALFARIWALLLLRPERDKMHCKFPAKIQWECVSEIIGIVRSGDRTKENLLNIIQHGACFAGCATELLKTGPDPGPIPGPDIIITGTSENDVAAICDELEKCIPAKGTATIDWKTLLNTVLPYILQLLNIFTQQLSK